MKDGAAYHNSNDVSLYYLNRPLKTLAFIEDPINPIMIS